MWRHIPNALTVSRAPLSVGFLVLAWNEYPWWALGLIVLACLTDALDGYLARKWSCETGFGKVADPWLDKLLCWSITIVVFQAHAFPIAVVPMVAIVLVYDIGLGVVRYLYGHARIPTSSDAKKKTEALMISLIILYLASFLPPAPGDGLYWVGAAYSWLASAYALRSIAGYLRSYNLMWLMPGWMTRIL